MSEPKLTEAQALVADWYGRWAGGHATLDDLAAEVARMVATAEQAARAEALREAADALYTWGHLPTKRSTRWRWMLMRTGLADNARVADWLRKRAQATR